MATCNGFFIKPTSKYHHMVRGYELRIQPMIFSRLKIQDETRGKCHKREFIGQFGYFKIRMSPVNYSFPLGLLGHPLGVQDTGNCYLHYCNKLLAVFFFSSLLPLQSDSFKEPKRCSKCDSDLVITTSTRKPQDLLNSAQSNP